MCCQTYGCISITYYKLPPSETLQYDRSQRHTFISQTSIIQRWKRDNLMCANIPESLSQVQWLRSHKLLKLVSLSTPTMFTSPLKTPRLCCQSCHYLVIIPWLYLFYNSVVTICFCVLTVHMLLYNTLYLLSRYTSSHCKALFGNVVCITSSPKT